MSNNIEGSALQYIEFRAGPPYFYLYFLFISDTVTFLAMLLALKQGHVTDSASPAIV